MLACVLAEEGRAVFWGSKTRNKAFGALNPAGQENKAFGALRSLRSPEASNFRSRLGIVDQHYLEAIPAESRRSPEENNF